MVEKLIVTEGDLKGLVLPFEENMGSWILGRDSEECQLTLDDPAASRQHARVDRTEKGLSLTNLSSTNPLVINGSPLDEGTHLLAQGDELVIGNTRLQFTTGPEVDNAEENDASQVEKGLSNDEEGIKPKEGKNSRSKKKEGVEPQEDLIEPSEDLEEEKPKETKVKPRKKKVDAKPPQDGESHEIEEEPLLGRESKSEEEDLPEHDTLFEEVDETPLPKRRVAKGAQIDFDLEQTGRWVLKVVGGPNNGAEFSLHSSTSYLIGNDPHSCDIIFHDTSVSRQHARISVDASEHLYLEDLGSRNGCFIDGEKIKGKHQVQSNTIITLGTTSFVVYDREGKIQTVISPLLPDIVKRLQMREKELEETQGPSLTPEQEAKLDEALASKSDESVQSAVGAFILIGIITGLFVIVGLGVATLFTSSEVEPEKELNTTTLITTALAPFPDVQHSFNKNTGQLLLVGHVQRAIDKNQLLYNLRGIPLIRHLDDAGLVIDEYVWNEINQVLSRNPRWKGIIVRSPQAGKFVIEGYLKTKDQAEQLNDYLGSNFPYLDLLEKRIVVEENVINSIDLELKRENIRKVKAQMSDGEITFTGGVPSDRIDQFQKILDEAEKIPGVRRVRNFTTKLAAAESMINISDRYEVTGFSSYGEGKYGVIIDGRILMMGDRIDGMQITSIQEGKILLEKDGVFYRIDFK